MKRVYRLVAPKYKDTVHEAPTKAGWPDVARQYVCSMSRFSNSKSQGKEFSAKSIKLSLNQFCLTQEIKATEPCSPSKLAQSLHFVTPKRKAEKGPSPFLGAKRRRLFDAKAEVQYTMDPCVTTDSAGDESVRCEVCRKSTHPSNTQTVASTIQHRCSAVGSFAPILMCAACWEFHQTALRTSVVQEELKKDKEEIGDVGCQLVKCPMCTRCWWPIGAAHRNAAAKSMGTCPECVARNPGRIV